MNGREDKKSNDLFFTCSLIDFIARKTFNKRSYVVNTLGKEKLVKIYDLADVYHCESIDNTADDFIESANIKNGKFDNISAARFTVPSHWDIGKVYKRLIIGISETKNIPIIDALFEAYNSFVSDKIDDYNSSFYYDAPKNILNSFLTGKIED